MTLVNKIGSRERVLVYGGEGVGKSLGALDIARHLPSTTTMYVIDNDNAWARMLENREWAGVAAREAWIWNGKEFEPNTTDFALEDGGRVVVYSIDDWVGYVEAAERIDGLVGRDDWWCIDSATPLWDDVQAWFVDQVFGDSIEDYFMRVRLEMGDGDKGGLEGWKDYGTGINPQFKAKLGKVLVNPPCHLYLTAEQAELGKLDDRETKGLYGELGYKVKGQKRMGHNVQTVLWLTRGRGGVFKVTTAKDRGGRDEVEAWDVSGRGFVDWYLVEIGGWEMHEEPAEKVAVKSKVRSK